LDEAVDDILEAIGESKKNKEELSFVMKVKGAEKIKDVALSESILSLTTGEILHL
jgi:hypothetical protein